MAHRPATVTIDVERCKGCVLCIDVCPPRVLVMTEHEVNAMGYRYPILLDGCTGCELCLQASVPTSASRSTAATAGGARVTRRAC